MSTDLQPMSHGALEAQVIEPSVDANMLAVIARAAADPSVDVVKMQALLDMHERMGRTRAEVEFKAALAEIQAQAPRVTHDGKIIVKGQIRSTYATLEAVDEALRPLTAQYGFSYEFSTQKTDAKELLVAMEVSHRAGHSKTKQMPLPVDANEYRSAVQNVRSSISFAKRCLICDFFNVITGGEDNGGQGGYISQEQAMTIETLLRDTNSNTEKFLAWAGAPAVAKIPVRRYAEAIQVLQGKRR